MNICSGGRGVKTHEKIVYEGRNCPFCAYMEEKESEIADLKKDIERLEESE